MSNFFLPNKKKLQVFQFEVVCVSRKSEEKKTNENSTISLHHSKVILSWRIYVIVKFWVLLLVHFIVVKRQDFCFIFFSEFSYHLKRERKKSWDILLSFFVIAAIHKLHKNLATAFLQQRNEKIKQKKYLKANILMYIYDNQTIHILLLIWIWVQHRKKTEYKIVSWICESKRDFPFRFLSFSYKRLKKIA